MEPQSPDKTDETGRAAREAELTDMRGRLLPPAALKIVAALAARPWKKPGYRVENIRPRSPELAKLEKAHRYFGQVPVAVTGHPGAEMMFHGDDTVARIYFWFGPDSFEATSVHLWCHLARDAAGVLDVGAYSGLYGILAARAAPSGQVVSFEPVPRIALRLAENVALNGLQNLAVRQEAVGAADGEGTMTLYGKAENSPGASLLSKNREHDRGTLDVVLRSLDSLDAEGVLPPRIDLIKFDTEGAEPDGLAGARRLIERDRPVIQCEVLNDAAMDQIGAFAASCDYAVHLVSEEKRALKPLGNNGRYRRPWGVSTGAGYANVLLSPDTETGDRLMQAAKAFAARPRTISGG